MIMNPQEFQATIMPKRKNEQIRFDSKIFNDKIIINNVIDPNFKDAESDEEKRMRNSRTIFA